MIACRRIDTPSRVWVLGPDRDSRSSMSRALENLCGEVGELEALDDSDPRLAAAGSKRILVVDFDSLDPQQRRSLKDWIRGSAGRCVLCSSSSDGAELAEVCEAGGLVNLVASNGGIDETELRITVEKLLGGQIFGLERYFASGPSPQTVTLTHSDDRSLVIERIADFASEIGLGRRLTNIVAVLADELVTNGLFNAPTTVSGRRRFAHLPRTESIRLLDHERLVIRWVLRREPFRSKRDRQVRITWRRRAPGVHDVALPRGGEDGPAWGQAGQASASIRRSRPSLSSFATSTFAAEPR